MAEIPYVKKQFTNTLFNERFLIETESDKRKLINAYAFLSAIDRIYGDAKDKFGFSEPLTYDGFPAKLWFANLERRIKEIDTIKCYENVSVINIARGGSVQLEYCDGSKSVRFINFGETIIKECVVKDSIKPYTDGKKYRVPAILKGIRYVQECGSVTTTTTTLSKG